MKSSRYHRRGRRSRVRGAMVAAVAVTFLLGSGLVFHGWNKHRIAAQHRTVPDPAIPDPARVVAYLRPVFRDAPRRVYPFSIIRGGAYSKEELLQALESDPVAESHYSVFQRAQLRTVRSTLAKPVYLSYRKGNLIFWTSHPVNLHDGETLLTDGHSYARSRCGNRISLVPQAPVAKDEPVPSVLDTPEPMEPIPEPLLRAAVELEPQQPTTLSLIGPEDFASPVSKPVGFDAPPGPFLTETFLKLVPVVGIANPGSPSTAVMPIEVRIPTVPYPVPIGFVPPPPLKLVPPSTVPEPAPVPEPSGLVPMIVAVSACVLWSLRRRRTRPEGRQTR